MASLFNIYMASLLKSKLAGEVDIFIVELMKDIMSIVMLYSWWRWVLIGNGSGVG